MHTPPRDNYQHSFLAPDLLDQLNPSHPLPTLSKAISWEYFEREFDCWRIARTEGIALTRTYAKEVKQRRLELRFEHHPTNRFKAKRARKRLNTIAGRLRRVQDQQGNVVDYFLDPAGNVTNTRFRKNGGSDYTAELDVKATFDNLGRRLTLKDPDRGLTTTVVNAFGETVRELNAKGEVTRNWQDDLGRVNKTAIYDSAASEAADKIAPDSTSATRSGEITFFTYNDLGEALDADDEANTAVRGNLQLSGVWHQAYNTINGSAAGSNFYLQGYSYDGFGRLRGKGDYVSQEDGVTYSTPQMFAETFHFDQYNRPLRHYDTAGFGFGTQNVYNAYGLVEQVKEINTGYVYSTIADLDARGQITQQVLGVNGVTRSMQYNAASGLPETIQTSTFLGLSTPQRLTYKHDTLGNITERTDQGQSADGSFRNNIDAFNYDDLNRLVGTGIFTTTFTTQLVTYDWKGNIVTKGDVNGGAAYSYSTAHPHAVSSIAAGGGNAAINFSYDTLGNMTGDGTRSFYYNNSGNLLRATKGATQIDYRYGPGDVRYLRKEASGSNATRYYNFGGTDFIVAPDGKTQVKRYVGDAVITTLGLTAPTTTGGILNGSLTGTLSGTDINFVLKDVLGSTDVVLNREGQVVEEGNFDAWGKRREAANWATTTLPSVTTLLRGITTHGFTGHEMVDDIGIIHMNGRIYDSLYARFLQADPFVQSPTNLQSFNRYSYVMNNPVNLTDPSGYYGINDLKRDVGNGVSSVNNALDGASRWTGTQLQGGIRSLDHIFGSDVVSILGTYGAYWVGGAYGVAIFTYENGRANGADKNDAAKGAAIAYVAASYSVGVGDGYSLTEVVAIDGTIGGVSSVLQGGKFGNGFVSAGVGAAVGGATNGWHSDLARIVAASVAGGTVSEMTGGKFANGAMTAAYAAVASVGLEHLPNEAGMQEIGPDGKSRTLTQKEYEKYKYMLADNNSEDARILDPAYDYLKGKMTDKAWSKLTSSVCKGAKDCSDLYQNIIKYGQVGGGPLGAMTVHPLASEIGGACAGGGGVDSVCKKPEEPKK